MRIMSIMLLLAVLLTSPVLAAAESSLTGAGATFPYPVYSAWAHEYNKITGVKLNYQSIGSGGGIRQVTERTVDFGASDKPLTQEELIKADLIQFPAIVGGVVIVFNIPGVKPGELRLDAESVCRIFLGEIKTWHDGKIRALNPGVKLPDKEITVVHRSDGSGTTAIFTDYLSGGCPAWKEKVGRGTAVDWPVGIGGKGNEGVANYVRRAKNSVGYVEFAYATQNKLSYALLKNRAGHFVEPGFASFEDAAATADFDPQKGFSLWLTNAPGKDAWPIAGASFILLAREKGATNKNVVKFFDWAFKNGDATAKALVYIPLPESLKEKIRTTWKKEGVY